MRDRQSKDSESRKQKKQVRSIFYAQPPPSYRKEIGQSAKTYPLLLNYKWDIKPGDAPVRRGRHRANR